MMAKSGMANNLPIDLPDEYPKTLRILFVMLSLKPGTKLMQIINTAKMKRMINADRNKLPFNLPLFPSLPF